MTHKKKLSHEHENLHRIKKILSLGSFARAVAAGKFHSLTHARNRHRLMMMVVREEVRVRERSFAREKILIKEYEKQLVEYNIKLSGNFSTQVVLE
jgi:hypothetical protein